MKQNRISVLTKQNIRYEGAVYAIDKIRKTVFLKEVRCFGTEDRQGALFIPPSTKITAMAEFHNDQILEIKKLQTTDLVDISFGLPKVKEENLRTSQKEQMTTILNQSYTQEITKSPLPKISGMKNKKHLSQSPDHEVPLKPVYITNNYLQLKKMEPYKRLMMFKRRG